MKNFCFLTRIQPNKRSTTSITHAVLFLPQGLSGTSSDQKKMFQSIVFANSK